MLGSRGNYGLMAAMLGGAEMVMVSASGVTPLATDEAIELLCALLANGAIPYFLRSAAAWSLSRTASPRASDQLVSAFSYVDLALRQEALDGLVAIGDSALPILLRGLLDTDDAIAAGCAEALRRGTLRRSAANHSSFFFISSSKAKKRMTCPRALSRSLRDLLPSSVS